MSPSPSSENPVSEVLAGVWPCPTSCLRVLTHRGGGGGMHEEGRLAASSLSLPVYDFVALISSGLEPFLHSTDNKANLRKQNFSGRCEVP